MAVTYITIGHRKNVWALRARKENEHKNLHCTYVRCMYVQCASTKYTQGYSVCYVCVGLCSDMIFWTACNKIDTQQTIQSKVHPVGSVSKCMKYKNDNNNNNNSWISIWFYIEKFNSMTTHDHRINNEDQNLIDINTNEKDCFSENWCDLPICGYVFFGFNNWIAWSSRLVCLIRVKRPNWPDHLNIYEIISRIKFRSTES